MTEQIRRPFDVNRIKDEPTVEDEIAKLAQSTGADRKVPANAKSQTEVDQGAFNVMRRDTSKKTMITFVEDGGYLILRITSEGKESEDLVMNSDQIKLLLRQMTLWVTR